MYSTSTTSDRILDVAGLFVSAIVFVIAVSVVVLIVGAAKRSYEIRKILKESKEQD